MAYSFSNAKIIQISDDFVNVRHEGDQKVGYTADDDDDDDVGRSDLQQKK